MERHVAFPITHTHKLLLFSEFSINDSIIKCSWNVDQPDMGATSIRALIVSDFPLNLSTTATNNLQFSFSLLKRSDSKVNDGERGKPAAAASKSLTASSLSCSLAISRGVSVPVWMFWLAGWLKWNICRSKRFFADRWQLVPILWLT